MASLMAVYAKEKIIILKKGNEINSSASAVVMELNVIFK